jgi:hypothetical protein
MVSPGAADNKIILIIDADADRRRYWMDQLGRLSADYVLLEAGDGQSCIDICRDHNGSRSGAMRHVLL